MSSVGREEIGRLPVELQGRMGGSRARNGRMHPARRFLPRAIGDRSGKAGRGRTGYQSAQPSVMCSPASPAGNKDVNQ